jgi:hypothetical protein
VVRALDALGPLGSFHPLGPLGSFDSLRPLGALHALGPLGSFDALHARDALGPIFASIDALETVLAAIGAPIFTAVFHTVFSTILAAVGAPLVFSTQHDPQAIVVLTHTHALELEVGGELLD